MGAIFLKTHVIKDTTIMRKSEKIFSSFLTVSEAAIGSHHVKPYSHWFSDNWQGDIN